MVYIESKIGHPDIVGEGAGGAIGFWGGVTGGVVNVLGNKVSGKV